MADRILRIKIEDCFGLPQQAVQTVEIKQYKNGDYYALHTYVNDDGNTETLKQPVSVNAIADIFDCLSSIQLTAAFPSHNRGCDGGFTELEVGGYEGCSRFRWWSEAPEEWKALDDVVNKILTLCSITLAHNDY